MWLSKQKGSDPEQCSRQAVDPVGATMAGTLASATRPGGTVYVYGTLGGVEVTIPTKDLVYRQVTVKGFWCGCKFVGCTERSMAAVVPVCSI